MKKIILTFIVLTLLISCSRNEQKEQYYGTWIAVDYPQEKPAYIKITADSIAYGQNEVIWNTFPVSISNSSLSFSKQIFESSISDSSLHIEGQEYKKLEIENPIEITSPKLERYNFDEPLITDEIIDIYYGKKPNTNDFFIRYNDRILDRSSIQQVILNEFNDVYRNIYKVALHCDKNTTMKDIEFLSLNISAMGFENILLVNNEKQRFETPRAVKKVNMEYHDLKILFNSNPNYQIGIPFRSAGDFHDRMTYFVQNNQPFQYTFLINNEFYYEKEKLTKQAFSDKLKTSIQNKVSLLMLYDLESNYKNYLEIISIYKQLLDEERNKTAISLFNTSFETLNDEQKNHVKNLHRYINIRQFSIPHFLSFEEYPLEDINFPFKNIKDQLPKAYFD